MRQADFPFLPKDFIQTAEGLIFAVIDYPSFDGKVGCFLRYIPDGSAWHKVDTGQAKAVLNDFPQYCYWAKQIDAEFHAVAPSEIVQHYRPEQHLQRLLSLPKATGLIKKLQQLMTLFSDYGFAMENIGITGSMLIGQQRNTSDIDLVIYGRAYFQQVRQIVKRALAAGQIAPLDEAQMRDNYQRRNATLSYDEFAWHEQRKLNKAVIEGTKFDIGMVLLPEERKPDSDTYQKIGHQILIARVMDDSRAFDFPACFRIDDKRIPEILVFTHTYVGQARAGEIIEVAGQVEKNTRSGQYRLIVGASREAEGEYIKVSRQ